MRLGNTGGNNKGKKYLIIKGDEPITQANQQKANAFNKWFEKEYASLRRKVASQDTICDVKYFTKHIYVLSTKYFMVGLL